MIKFELVVSIINSFRFLTIKWYSSNLVPNLQYIFSFKYFRDVDFISKVIIIFMYISSYINLKKIFKKYIKKLLKYKFFN